MVESAVRPRIAWDSVLTDATLSSLPGTTEDDGPREYAVDWLPWTFYRPTGTMPLTLAADFGETRQVNAFALAGHDCEGTVAMEYWDGSGWVELLTTEAAGDGATIYLYSETTVSTTKVRFKIDDLTFLAVLWAGVDMELPEGVGPGWSDPVLALRARLTHEVSRAGVWLGSSVEQWTAQLSLDLKNVATSWAVTNWLPFMRQCSTQPFFLHWNPTVWSSSACLCTQAQFGNADFSQPQFLNLSVSFDADVGYDRRNAPE